MIAFVIGVILLPHILAGITTVWWYRWNRYSKNALIWHIVGCLALTYLSLRFLPWCYTSIYFPYVYGFLWMAIVVYTSWKRSPTHSSNRVRPGKVIAIMLLGTLAIFHYWQQRPTDNWVDWPLPLQGKHYYVQQGGHSWLTNPFHHRYHAQSRAIDIVRLNEWGNRAYGLLPDELEKYTIYGDTVFSPITGKVIRSRNDRSEPTPPHMDASLPLGNHVIIQKDDTLVILGHLIPGSVAVSKGELVEVGAVLGQVGNSGRSSEPHLHYQVVLQTETGWEPIGIKWAGRYPSTGDAL